MARDFLEMFTPRDMCETIYMCKADTVQASEFLSLVTGKFHISLSTPYMSSIISYVDIFIL